MHGIVFGLHNKSRRSLAGDVNLRIWRKVLFRESQVAGINDHGEIRTAADPICGVNELVEALLEVRAKCSSQVSAGGESQYADTIGINVPLGGMGADNPQRALGVLQRCRGL